MKKTVFNYSELYFFKENSFKIHTLIISFLFSGKILPTGQFDGIFAIVNSLSPRAEAEEDGEEVISPDGQYLMHMAAQSWLLLGGATKLNITQKRFLSARSPGWPAPAARGPFSPAQLGRRPAAAWSAGFSFEVWAELHYLQAQSWLETILPTTGGSQIIPHRTLILHSWHPLRLLEHIADSPKVQMVIFKSM